MSFFGRAGPQGVKAAAEISGDCSAPALPAAAQQAAMMEELRSWQALVSLWERMDDRRLHVHEAPSTFEVGRPVRAGWLVRRSKSAVFVEWRRHWAVLKRAHLFLFDRPDSTRPSNWYLLRKADVRVRGKTSGQHHVVELLLPHRRKVVLAAASDEDMRGWLETLDRAISMGTSDPRACRPLHCAPALVKQRALGGVPDCFRGIVWQKLTAADALRQRHPDRYKALLSIEAPVDAMVRRDLHRTMPKNAFFKEEEPGARGGGGCARGQQLLFNVVHAYAVHDSAVGYSQGINFLSAVLLLHMRQEQAFWVLVQLMRRYRIRGLFEANNPQLALEHFKLERLTMLCTPALHQHFTEQGVDISVFTSEWLITLFSYTFPLSFTFRVWDTLFVKGFAYILQVAVAILRTLECELLSLNFEAIVFLLREIPARLAADAKLAEAILAAAHKVTWDYDALEAEASAFVAACVARDARDVQSSSAAAPATHEAAVEASNSGGELPSEEAMQQLTGQLPENQDPQPSKLRADRRTHHGEPRVGEREETACTTMVGEGCRGEMQATEATSCRPDGAVAAEEDGCSRHGTRSEVACVGGTRETPESEIARPIAGTAEREGLSAVAEMQDGSGAGWRRSVHRHVGGAIGGVGAAIGGLGGRIAGSGAVVLKSAGHLALLPVNGAIAGVGVLGQASGLTGTRSDAAAVACDGEHAEKEQVADGAQESEQVLERHARTEPEHLGDAFSNATGEIASDAFPGLGIAGDDFA